MAEADARTLVVLIGGRRAGIATQGSDGRLAFSYDAAWYETRDPTPLSLSMPTDGRRGSPQGAVPTTHILKPAVQGFDDHDLNEHLCLEVVRRLGIPAAASQVMSFEDERAIIVERYDRARTADGELRRIHQEDMCQALAVLPTGKYQNEGGPSPEQIVRLLRATVRPESATAESTGWFVDALALSWILGGTDAHAKNYSVLLAGSQVRLAPLYDVASEQLAVAASAPSVRSLDTDLPDRLVDAVAAWAGQCRRSLEA